MSTFYDLVGGIGISAGIHIIHFESLIFNKFDYIQPIYNTIKYVESFIPQFSSQPPSSLRYGRSNVSNQKTSSGKHLASYYARQRMRHKQQVISVSHKKQDDNYIHHHGTNQNRKYALPKDPYVYNEYIFHPYDDPSYQNDSWYDAISPYWTGGMVWRGAYVLNHQVVSVTTDPIFVSNLLPAQELSATIQTSEGRSGGENVGPRATIALDSGSSIHIFKDSFLLTDIHSDEKQSIGVRTTDSKFRVNDIGRLCDDLNILPLPSEGYYYYPKGVANILSHAMVAETKRVVMDSAINNSIYVFNEDGSYVRFSCTSNGMYCIDINTDENSQVVMAHQTVKGESAYFSAIDCRRAAKIRELQEILACPSDIDLANAVEHNVIGNNPFTRRDIRIAKKIYGPDVPAMKGRLLRERAKCQGKMKLQIFHQSL
jgi:hypothetical protein